MEIEIHDQLTALAHPKRLDLFRLLMRRYPNTVPAGEIAAALDLKPNTTSSYLSALRQAGLIDQRRVGTSLQYSAALPEIRTLFSGLLTNCCQNRPDLCLPTPESMIGGSAAEPTPDRKRNALFICTGNSARSIMAEAILRTEAGERFNAYSAGTAPAKAPHPEVMELLKSKKIDIDSLAPKSLEAFRAPDAPQMDFVFTVCDHAANEECPVWPGHPMSAHWGLPDPAAASGTPAEQKLAFQQVFGLLRNRIRAFSSLPIGTLDQISLQHQIDDIGRMDGRDQ